MKLLAGKAPLGDLIKKDEARLKELREAQRPVDAQKAAAPVQEKALAATTDMLKILRTAAEQALAKKMNIDGHMEFQALDSSSETSLANTAWGYVEKHVASALGRDLSDKEKKALRDVMSVK